MTVNSKLSQLSKEWKAAEAIAPSFSSVPEGDYVAALREIKVDESKKGRLQAVSVYEIVDGDYTGQTVKRFDGLVDRQTMGYFKGYAEIIGFEVPEDLELLQESMDAFVGGCGDLFNLHVAKSKGEDGKDYTNVYVNGISEFVMGDGQEVVEGEAQEEVVEEEVQEEAQEEVVEEIQEEVIEEEPQQVTAPIKRFSSKPAATQKKAVPTTKPAQQKPVAQLPRSAAKPTITKTAPVVTAGRRIAAAGKR